MTILARFALVGDRSSPDVDIRPRSPCGCSPPRPSTAAHGSPSPTGRGGLTAHGLTRRSPLTPLPRAGSGARRRRVLLYPPVKLVVPTETLAGERRVAIVPDVAARLAGTGVEVAVQVRCRRCRPLPRRRLCRRRCDRRRRRRRPAAGRRRRGQGAAAVAGRGRGTRPRDLDGELPRAREPTSRSYAAGRQEGHRLQPGARPSHQPGPVDGRAVRRRRPCRAISPAWRRPSGCPKFFPMFMTAAGTVPPAKVLVLGAGVAGLQAIATARRLGAQVRAYDVRAAAKEEVQSLGAAFVELAARDPGRLRRLRP